MNIQPKALSLQSVIELLSRHESLDHRGELRLYVQTYNPGTCGGTPCDPVTDIIAGFDWDHGKLIIQTERKLSALTQEQVEAVLESVRKGSSWHAYQREKKVSDEKKALKSQRDELLNALVTALPYVESAESDPAYKAGAVAKVVAQMKAAIAKAGA